MAYCQYSQNEQYRTLKYCQSVLGLSQVLPAENIFDAHLSIRHARSILGVLRVYTLVLRVVAV